MALRTKSIITLILCILLLNSHAAQASSTTYSSTKYKYYFQYPTSWEGKTDWNKNTYKSLALLTIDNFTLPTTSDNEKSYAVTAGKYSDALSYTKTQGAALKKGWNQFLSQFKKEYRQTYGPTSSDPNNKVLSLTEKKKIQNYTASRVDAKIVFQSSLTVNGTNTSETIYAYDSFVFIRKPGGTLYYIEGTFSSADATTKSNPYASQFTNLAKSFRIGIYKAPPSQSVIAQPPSTSAILNMSNINVSHGSQYLFIIWNTDHAANGTVYYGTSTAYGSTAIEGGTGTSHLISIPVVNGKTYHYKIKSCLLTDTGSIDENKCINSTDGTFVVK